MLKKRKNYANDCGRGAQIAFKIQRLAQICINYKIKVGSCPRDVRDVFQTFLIWG